jgi:hypothetical protein
MDDPVGKAVSVGCDPEEPMLPVDDPHLSDTEPAEAT